MKKKNTGLKLDKMQKANIAYFKQYFNDYCPKIAELQSLNFEEFNQDGAYVYTAVLDYGFAVQSVYYCIDVLDSGFIDTYFTYKNSDYKYLFYDIFNLFDVDDFNLYYYEDCLYEEAIKTALDTIMHAFAKNSYFIMRAGNPDYLPQLQANYEADRNAVCGGSDWKEDSECPFYSDFAHPVCSLAGGKIIDKTIKKLKKKADKGELETLYEKRLLKYLESGRSVDRRIFDKNKNFSKKYKEYRFKAYAVLTLASFVFVYGSSMLIRAEAFSGAQYVCDELILMGFRFSKQFLSPLAAAGCFAILLILIFGKKLSAAFAPEEDRKRVAEKYFSEEVQNSDFGAKGVMPAKIIGGIILAVITFFSYSVSAAGEAFYDDYFFIKENIFHEEKISYEELELYRVSGYYDADGEFLEYENGYLVGNGRGYYSELSELEENGEAEKRLLEIAEANGKEIKEIKTADELYDE